MCAAFSIATIQMKAEQLQKRINYKFQNLSLLQQALTRQNAIQEQHPDAYAKSFQALEFVGDAALKHGIARLLYSKHDGKANESQLHDETKELIGNDRVLPEIARRIKLDELLIKGNGEIINSKILADSLEALLGAISIDCGQKQEKLLNVIKHLWHSYIEKKKVLSTVPVMPALVIPTLAAVPIAKSLQRKFDPVPRDNQRIFSSMSINTPVASFKKHVEKVSNINRRNVGKEGNPALMMLLKKENLRKEDELPKIKILLDHGADWTVTNNKGISAEQLASLKHGGREAVLKKINEL